MAKNKTKPQSETALLAHPFITLDFKKVPVAKYADALKVLFANPDFSELVEKRNAMMRTFCRMRNNSEKDFLVKSLLARDKKLSDMLYFALVQTSIHADETYDFFSFTTLLKYYVDYSREGMADLVNRLATNLDRITFLADMLESLLTDVKADMRTIFGGTIEFNQFDAVAQVLKQLRGFFKNTRSGDWESPEFQLYLEYSDSINDYLARRLKTYTEKYRKLHPLPRVYTDREMIAAVNQFFGTDQVFGDDIIKHTESGGCYIDALSLMRRLAPTQTEKLNVQVKSVDDSISASFAVTDAIMGQYRPIHP